MTLMNSRKTATPLTPPMFRIWMNPKIGAALWDGAWNRREAPVGRRWGLGWWWASTAALKGNTGGPATRSSTAFWTDPGKNVRTKKSKNSRWIRSFLQHKMVLHFTLQAKERLEGSSQRNLERANCNLTPRKRSRRPPRRGASLPNPWKRCWGRSKTC